MSTLGWADANLDVDVYDDQRFDDQQDALHDRAIELETDHEDGWS